MVTAVFESAETYQTVTDEVWQYDYGQILRIEGLDLDSATEIDFSVSEKEGTALSVVGTRTSDGATEVTIPDKILAKKGNGNYSAYAFVYEVDSDSGETTHRIRIPVKARPARSNYEGTEEADLLASAVTAVNEAAERAEVANNAAQVAMEEIQESLEQISENADNIAELQALGLSVVDGAINITYEA